MSALTWIKTAAKVSTGGFSSLYLYGGLLAAGAALSGGAWLWHGWKVDGAHDAAFKAGRKEAEYEHQTALLEGLREGTRQTDHLQRTKDEAIKAAQTRATENAAAAGRAKSELARLRESSAAGASNAVTSIAACSEYTATATTVLNECSAALVELGQVADGHVNDIKTLTGSWPAWDKFASEMTDFTNRLKGTP